MFKGANAKAIEKALGCVFPPSYRTFLGITNGCVSLGVHSEPPYRVPRFEVYATDWPGAYTFPNAQAYANYGPEGAEGFRSTDLKDCLLIGESTPPLVLLNPNARSGEEWEVLFLDSESTWRYHSFEAMILDQRGYALADLGHALSSVANMT